MHCEESKQCELNFTFSFENHTLPQAETIMKNLHFELELRYSGQKL